MSQNVSERGEGGEEGDGSWGMQEPARLGSGSFWRMQEEAEGCRFHPGVQDTPGGAGFPGGSASTVPTLCPPRAVKTSLSLLCAELRGDPEPQKKRSKLTGGTFSSLQGSPVSPMGSGGCVLPPTPP